MIFGFNHFHPIKGTPPREASWIGGEIIFRARSLLRNRNVKHIRAAIGVVNWLIEYSPARELVWKDLTKDAEFQAFLENESTKKTKPKVTFDEISRDWYTAVNSLRTCINEYDLTGYPHIPNLRWSELFAILALSLIDKAVDDEKYYGSWKEDGDFDFMHMYRVTSHVMVWLVMAMDAVAQAEGLSAYEEASKYIDADIQNKISLRNKQAGILRHAKTNDAALKLSDYYRGGQFKSIRECVQRFIELNPKLVEHLTPTNRLRTLSERLSTMLKQSGGK